MTTIRSDDGAELVDISTKVSKHVPYFTRRIGPRLSIYKDSPILYLGTCIEV
jgi:hypothetical protein